MRSRRTGLGRGVTLIELMFAVGLFFLCMAMAFTVFSDGIKNVNLGKQKLKLQDDARSAMEVMTTEFREGVTIDAASKTALQTGTSTITFQKNDPFKVDDIANPDKGLTVRYDVFDHQIRRTEVLTGNQSYIGNNILLDTDLVFKFGDTGVDPSTIRITIKETDLSGRVKQPYILLGRANLRILNSTGNPTGVDDIRAIERIEPLVRF